MIKGHINRILWNKVDKTGDYLEVGFIIKDLDEDTYKIKGKIRIIPYPSINDYIIAHKTDKTYSGDIFVCSLINIELPIKQDLILLKIRKLSDKSLTKKEEIFLIDNNKDIWDKIYNKNLEIGKIKQNKIDIIYNNFEYEKMYKSDREKLNDFLYNCGIKLKDNQIDNLIDKYKESSKIIEIMNNNLIEISKVDGISITTLINIANKLNHTEDEKIELFILYNLDSPNGDTCIKYDKLIAEILKEKGEKFSRSLDKGKIDDIIDELIDNDYIIRYNEYLYESSIFEHENNIGSFLSSENNNEPYLERYLEDAEIFLEDYEGSKLNNEQRDSFLSVFKSNVNITIGPAGTGKSEILTRLCKFIEDYSEISILFLTPTGKACSRLTKGFKGKGIEKTKSYTIHKFIHYKVNDLFNSCKKSDVSSHYEEDFDENIKNKKNYSEEDFDENIKNKKIYSEEDFNNIFKNEYKIIVIDEMSMVSLDIFNQFVDKIKELDNCVLLVLGDVNQLPSISCGDVLNNLVLSKSFNLVELKDIFRSESKGLLEVQKNILKFKPLLENIPDNDNSFVWIKEDPKDINVILKVLDEFEKLPLIITSTNKVVNDYQNIIKKKYNIEFETKNCTAINGLIFHEDDTIMIKKNVSDNELTNGMIGKIIDIKKEIEEIEIGGKKKQKEITKLTILFDEKKETIDTRDLIDIIDLGYIMTIHKSQGSE